MSFLSLVSFSCFLVAITEQCCLPMVSGHETKDLSYLQLILLGIFVSAVDRCLSALIKRMLPRTQVLYLPQEDRGNTNHLNEEVSSPLQLPV